MVNTVSQILSDLSKISNENEILSQKGGPTAPDPLWIRRWVFA